jgi:hypothetical protein
VSARRILIEGPTLNGQFFIRDDQNNVWDGSQWRGFGMAQTFNTFREAILSAAAAKETARTSTTKGK